MVMLMVMVMVMVMVAGMKKPESGRNRTPARFRQIEPELLGPGRALIHFPLKLIDWRSRSRVTRWPACGRNLRAVQAWNPTRHGAARKWLMGV
jgi:hypothetical protein